MSELIERLIELSTPGNQPDPTKRTASPQGWEPGIKYEPDGRMTVTTPPSQEAATPDAQRKLVESFGAMVPAGWKLVLREARFDPAAWTREAQGEDAITRPVWRYRFTVEPDIKTLDITELLTSIGKPRKKPERALESGAHLGVVAADMQWGKSDMGGSEKALERWLESSDKVIDRYKREIKAKRVRGATLMLPGDCIEGTQSGSNRLTRLDLTLTEQMRVYRRTLLELVKGLADQGLPVTVAVVGGNHDEATRTGGELNTTYDDSWAIEGAAQVADALNLAGFDNVSFVFPKRDTLTLVIDIQGTNVGLLHGHQCRGKMEQWLAGQAQGRHPIGTADLVISGHYHHLVVKQIGPTTWLQAPALESGSQWFENTAGLSAPKGMVTMLIGQGGWTSLEVL